MKKKLTIKVTKKDIGEGVMSDLYTCPIALATKRALGGNKLIRVGGILIEFPNGIFAELPEKAKLFIGNFDKKFDVKPFQFTISYGK